MIKNSDDPNLVDSSSYEYVKCHIYEKDNIDVALAQNIKSNNPDIIKLKTVIFDFLKVENQSNSNYAYALIAHIYRNYERDAKKLLDGRIITMYCQNGKPNTINLFKNIMGNETSNNLGGQTLRHRIKENLTTKTLSDKDANTLGLYLAKMFPHSILA